MIGATHERTRRVPDVERVCSARTDRLGWRAPTYKRPALLCGRAMMHHRNATLYESAQTLKSRQTEA